MFYQTPRGINGDHIVVLLVAAGLLALVLEVAKWLL